MIKGLFAKNLRKCMEDHFIELFRPKLDLYISKKLMHDIINYLNLVYL